MLRALAATVLSAVLYGLSFPPTSWRWLAWVALAPLLLALRGASLPRALGLAWLWSVLAAWLVGDWMPGAVANYFLQPPWVGFAFFAGITTLTGSFYYMAFAALYRLLAARFTLALPWLAAAAWVGAELGRARLLTGSEVFVGNPWALAGYSQVGWAPVLQIAAVTGIYGVSFALAAAGAGCAEVLRAVWERAPLRRALLPLLAGAAPAVGVLAYGAVSLRDAERAAAGEAVPVAVVQGNLDVGSRWRAEFYGKNLQDYLRLTLESVDRGAPRIAFWPEGALTFLLEEEPPYQRAIARLLTAADLELVAGGPSASDGEPAEYRNSIFALSAAGELAGRYDKQFLVPFSEYFPLRRFDFLRRRFERVRVFTPGAPTPPLETRAGAAGVLVCNEAMLAEVAAERVGQGAAYLVNPSNDSWIAQHNWAVMMFDLVSVRAIEQRRYLVRASTSGPSGIVDPWGRVQARTEPFTQQILLGEIRPRTDRTLYARLGDTFALTCLTAALLGTLVKKVK
ncbi:MAG: apolipoprotein N-acyltransferase [Myxococcota bacterium]|nr:apolipoprotein N-acyltransferase [Myxococcota bacterium]